MSVRITYFVHGTTTDNSENISSGWNDCNLSSLGEEQSKELGQTTSKEIFDIVFTSDLKRAKDSARLAWSNKYPTISDTRLRECNYGEYNGKPSTIVEPMQEKMITERFPNGESCEDVEIRIKDFLAMLKKEYDCKHVVIVAHKAPQLALDVLLKKMSWEEAFRGDWRKTKSWQPGWEYFLP